MSILRPIYVGLTFFFHTFIYSLFFFRILQVGHRLIHHFITSGTLPSISVSPQSLWSSPWCCCGQAEFPLAVLCVLTRFRMQQVNIVGSSPMSAPSRLIQTLQDAPDTHPSNLTLLSSEQTSLHVVWKVQRHDIHLKFANTEKLVTFK